MFCFVLSTTNAPDFSPFGTTSSFYICYNSSAQRQVELRCCTSTGNLSNRTVHDASANFTQARHRGDVDGVSDVEGVKVVLSVIIRACDGTSIKTS